MIEQTQARRGRPQKINWAAYAGKTTSFNWRTLGFTSMNSMRVSLANAKRREAISNYKSKAVDENELEVTING